MSRASDLAPLFFPPPENEVGFRQGQVVSFDLDNGENVIDVGGAQLVNVPLLNVTDSVSLQAGTIVALLKWKSSWWIIGRVILPNSEGYGELCAFENNGEGVCLTQNGIDIYPPEPPDDVARIFAQHFFDGDGRMWLEMIPPREKGTTGSNRFLIEGGNVNGDGSDGSFRLKTAGQGTIETESNLFITAGNQYQVLATGSAFLNSDADVNVDAGNDVLIEATNNLTVDTGDLGIFRAGGSVIIDGQGDEVQLLSGNNECHVDVQTTTAGSPNAQLDGASNPRQLRVNTSSRRYKQDIEDLDIDPREVLNLRPRTWRDKAQVEEDPDEDRRYAGFIAEEVAEVPGMDQFVVYNENFDIQSVAYDRLTAALVSVVQDQRKQLDALSARVSELEKHHA